MFCQFKGHLDPMIGSDQLIPSGKCFNIHVGHGGGKPTVVASMNYDGTVEKR